MTTDWWCSDGTYNHNVTASATEGLGNSLADFDGSTTAVVLKSLFT